MSFENILPPMVPDEVVQQRLAICHTCEFRITAPVVNVEICKACGCTLALKTKFEQVRCPMGKW